MEAADFIEGTGGEKRNAVIIFWRNVFTLFHLTVTCECSAFSESPFSFSFFFSVKSK